MQLQPIDFEYFRTAYFACSVLVAICVAALGVIVELKDGDL